MRKTILGLALLAAPTAIAAQVVETSTITNRYDYQVGDQSGSGSDNGGTTEINQSVVSPTGGVSEMGLSMTGTLNDGSFFFLQDGACVGLCSITMVTQITFFLTNLGSDPVDLRFDSQITPGHLANSFLEDNTNSIASFDFSVAQEQGIRQGLIYSADGDATNNPLSINTNDGSTFNNILYDSNSDPEWDVLDWSATDLSLPLATLGPGLSTTLTYLSILTIATSQTDCADPTLCESFQVAFGDPRNAGGINALSAMSASSFSAFAPFASVLNAPQDPLTPAVGAEFDPFQVFYQFVQVDTPPPLPSGPTGTVTYGTNYRGPTGAVPEPATWLMLLLGFFAVGAMVRRRNEVSGPAVGRVQ